MFGTDPLSELAAAPGWSQNQSWELDRCTSCDLSVDLLSGSKWGIYLKTATERQENKPDLQYVWDMFADFSLL